MPARSVEAIAVPGDAIEDAIVAAGGQTLARATYASRNQYGGEADYDEEYDERDRDRWEPGETWRGRDDELEYPPDELYSESTLPPG